MDQVAFDTAGFDLVLRRMIAERQQKIAMLEAEIIDCRAILADQKRVVAQQDTVLAG